MSGFVHCQQGKVIRERQHGDSVLPRVAKVWGIFDGSENEMNSKMKMIGDRGSPWKTPLANLKGWDFHDLVMTEAQPLSSTMSL